MSTRLFLGAVAVLAAGCAGTAGVSHPGSWNTSTPPSQKFLDDRQACLEDQSVFIACMQARGWQQRPRRQGGGSNGGY